MGLEMSPIARCEILNKLKNTLQGYKKERAILEKSELAIMRNIVRIRKMLT